MTKVIDKFRNIKPGDSAIIKGRRNSLALYRFQVQKELGCKFQVKTIEEPDIIIEVSRKK